MGLGGYARYAVYWAPEAGSSLARLGAGWLGWDPEARRASDPPLPDLVAAPARYGLHATLKAPFRLAEGVSAKALETALAALSGARAEVAGPLLEIDDGLGFLALRPTAPNEALDALAAACVRELDHLRAPLTDAELAKRRASGLTARQEANLSRWGYPHLLDEFRFHVTLSRRLGPDEADAARKAATKWFAPALATPLAIRELCLFGDPGDGAPFHLLHRYALAG